MLPRTEKDAVDHVRENLLHRFPELAPELVEAAVIREHARLTGPIRAFIPLLVENKARQTLQALRYDGDQPWAGEPNSAPLVA